MQNNKDTFAFEDSFDAVKEATEVFDDFSDEVQDALTSFNSHCRPDCWMSCDFGDIWSLKLINKLRLSTV